MTTQRKRRRGGAGLGRTQRLVLRLLADNAKSPRHLEYDWPGLTESAARSAVMRLADRGLVDLAGWDDRNRRTYCLTDRGAEVERGLNRDEFSDEDEEQEDDHQPHLDMSGWAPAINAYCA